MITGIQSAGALSLSRQISAAKINGPTKDLSASDISTKTVSQESFSNILGNMVSGVAGDLRNAEKVSMDGMVGKATTREVVEAVMSAEQSLQASLAIRDKIVTAYLEISRMQI